MPTAIVPSILGSGSTTGLAEPSWATARIEVPTVGTSMRAVAQEGSASPVVEPDPSIEGTIAVGMVGNPQMVALQELVGAGVFNELYPNITVELTVLPENEIRQDGELDGNVRVELVEH